MTKILHIFFEEIETCEFQYRLVYMDGALTLNCYCTGYSRTRHLKACLYRAWPRTRTRRSHWIAYKKFAWGRFYQRRPRTRLEIGSCEKSQDCLWSEFLGDGRTNYFLWINQFIVFVELGPGFTRWNLCGWIWSSFAKWWYLPQIWRFCKVGCTYIPRI